MSSNGCTVITVILYKYWCFKVIIGTVVTVSIEMRSKLTYSYTYSDTVVKIFTRCTSSVDFGFSLIFFGS
jgi:hypothetical protein